MPTQLVAEELIPDKVVLDTLSSNKKYGMSDLFLWSYPETPQVTIQAGGPRTQPLEAVEEYLVTSRAQLYEFEAEAAKEDAYGNGRTDEVARGHMTVHLQLELLNMVDGFYKGQLASGNSPDQAIAWLFDYVDQQDEAAKKRYGEFMFEAIQKGNILPDELPETPADTIAQLLLADSDHWVLRGQNYNMNQWRRRLDRLAFERMSAMALVRMVDSANSL